jgi:hypothetical protein
MRPGVSALATFKDALQAITDVARTYFGGDANRQGKIDAILDGLSTRRHRGLTLLDHSYLDLHRHNPHGPDLIPEHVREQQSHRPARPACADRSR